MLVASSVMLVVVLLLEVQSRPVISMYQIRVFCLTFFFCIFCSPAWKLDTDDQVGDVLHAQINAQISALSRPGCQMVGKWSFWRNWNPCFFYTTTTGTGMACCNDGCIFLSRFWDFGEAACNQLLSAIVNWSEQVECKMEEGVKHGNSRQYGRKDQHFWLSFWPIQSEHAWFWWFWMQLLKLTSLGAIAPRAFDVTWKHDHFTWHGEQTASGISFARRIAGQQMWNWVVVLPQWLTWQFQISNTNTSNTNTGNTICH